MNNRLGVTFYLLLDIRSGNSKLGVYWGNTSDLLEFRASLPLSGFSESVALPESMNLGLCHSIPCVCGQRPWVLPVYSTSSTDGECLTLGFNCPRLNVQAQCVYYMSFSYSSLGTDKN